VFSHDGPVPTGAISIYTRADKPLLGEDDIAFASRLCRHLARAHRILDSMRALQHEHEVFSEIIDRLPAGLVLVDEHGQVVTMNESARMSIASGKGLQVEEGRPVIEDPDENRWLQDALRRARSAETRSEVDPEGSPEVLRAGADGQTPVMVAPLRAPASRSTMPDTAALIFLGSPHLAHHSAVKLLRSLYELTGAEAELTWLLADGLSLEQAAEQRGVTLNTARSQLKRVFAKTGAKRQAELVRIVLGGVGAIRGPR
jgi:DNA-binding CsgD family transcriptional regulator